MIKAPLYQILFLEKMKTVFKVTIIKNENAQVYASNKISVILQAENTAGITR